MKVKIMLALIIIAAAWVVGRETSGGRPGGTVETGEGREETRQSYQLSPGARVEVRSISGSVAVETSEAGSIEVHIVRTARNRADLDHNKVVVEQTLNSLTVQGTNGGRGWWHSLWGGGDGVRQEVTLRIPRKSELTARGINCPLTIGEIEGGLRVSGVNGRVEVAQTNGSAEINGVNGAVSLTTSAVGEQGIQVSGVNGGVTLRFGDAVNADLKVHGLNGSVASNLLNMKIEEQEEHSRMRARIGTGGAPITVSGINGRVQLEPASQVAARR